MAQRDIRTVRTALLEVAYEDSGPHDGAPVFLLHGWPDDASTWDQIRSPLNRAGFRTICPYLRGFGQTAFHDAGTMRSGQITAFVSDLFDTADALGIGRFSLVGHDWGGRTAYAAGALNGPRLRSCAVLGVSYRTPPGNDTFPLFQAQNYWYQWFMRTPLGQRQLEENRHEFCHYLWQEWTSEKNWSRNTYDLASLSFQNPDWLAITLHSYLHRWGDAAGDDRYAPLEESLRDDPFIRVPTMVLHGLLDTCNAPATFADRDAWFEAGYTRHGIHACGHFPQREQSATVAEHLIRFLSEGRQALSGSIPEINSSGAS
jgi:pimeloyl-ACP methyl ester carboxylesterase